MSGRLEERFRAALAGAPANALGRWVVAVSGGLDSVVLLHLLRFAANERRDLVVAHFDHRMRPESAEDAQWVAGLAAGWGIECRLGEAGTPPGSEAEAREARYRFLQTVTDDVGASLVVTAHHADDQAETVLFRALRGTGRAGLAGIPARRGLYFRPLLRFWRAELEAYARRARLSWRDDPTNSSLRYARNALRHRVLPEIERLVAPGARRALVRLSAIAREDEAAWASVLPSLLEPLDVTEREGAVSVDRDALAALHPAVRARILRALASGLGVTLEETGTRLAGEFVASAGSGLALDVGGGLTLRRELDRVWLDVVPTRLDASADRPLVIPDARPGSGEAWLAGRPVSVSWGRADVGGALRSASFDPRTLRFPLRVRAREAGDRIRLPSGTKKVKKVLLEARIPRIERAGVPMVVDARGDVLWIPGVARAVGDPPREDDREPRALTILVG
ncbi:MAG: tRNA lysidine(34) synthetase TilS [Gemmatimonadales bacterium]